MYISKHDGNSENLMLKVHNLYGKVICNVATKLVRYVLQGSVDT